MLNIRIFHILLYSKLEYIIKMKINTLPEKYCGKYVSPQEMLGLLKKN